MKKTINDLIKKQKTEKLDFLFFWGDKPRDNGIIDESCFSQWFYEPFVLDGVPYKTCEHYMMAQKAILFDDMNSFYEIVDSLIPSHAKSLGRNVKNFDEKIWCDNRFKIVVEGNFQKFSRNPFLKKFLLNTGDKILVEASPYDKIWGIGLNKFNPDALDVEKWRGLNLLGFALMEVRKKLLNNNKNINR